MMRINENDDLNTCRELAQVILVNTWFVHSTLADRQGAYAASTTAANFLRSITPNSGAYHVSPSNCH